MRGRALVGCPELEHNALVHASEPITSDERFDLHVLGPDTAPWFGAIVRGSGEHANLRERLAGLDVLFLVADGAPAVVAMPVARWIELLHAVGALRPIRCVW